MQIGRRNSRALGCNLNSGQTKYTRGCNAAAATAAATTSKDEPSAGPTLTRKAAQYRYFGRVTDVQILAQRKGPFGLHYKERDTSRGAPQVWRRPCWRRASSAGRNLIISAGGCACFTLATATTIQLITSDKLAESAHTLQLASQHGNLCDAKRGSLTGEVKAGNSGNF